MNWQLQEAKNKFGKLVDEARRNGPQVVTVRGKEAAVVLSIEEYSTLTRHQDSLIEFFQKSPLRGIDLDITRDQDPGRNIEL